MGADPLRERGEEELLVRDQARVGHEIADWLCAAWRSQAGVNRKPLSWPLSTVTSACRPASPAMSSISSRRSTISART